METFTIYIRHPAGSVLEFHVEALDSVDATFTALEHFQRLFEATPARVRQTPFTAGRSRWLH